VEGKSQRYLGYQSLVSYILNFAFHNRRNYMPDDANNAGGKKSKDCTLILTEGDSAKSLAVSGLGVVGRDNYGVFPLKGKLLNVREATFSQVCISAQ
jgi:DNA gyrase/topoisomerase IV subunit B